MFRTALALGSTVLAAVVLFGCGGGSQQPGTSLTGITRAGKPGPPPPAPVASKIAFVQSGRLWVVGEDGTGRTGVNTGSTGAAYWPAWSRVPINGKFMIATVRGSRLYVMNADGTGRRVVIDVGAAYVYAPCWSPDGTEIVYVVSSDTRGLLATTAAGYLHVVNVATGADTPVVNAATGVPIIGNSPAWSRADLGHPGLPDRIGYVWAGSLPEQGPNGIYVISRPAPDQPWAAPVPIAPPAGTPSTYPGRVVMWSDPDPNGTAWFGWRGTSLWLAPVDTTTGLPNTMQWTSAPPFAEWPNTGSVISFSPDATRVCYSSGALRVLNLTNGADTLLMPAEKDPGGIQPNWSPRLN